jgi:hypothetical protein
VVAGERSACVRLAEITSGEADGRCRECCCSSDHPERDAPDEGGRRWWLDRFTDDDVVLFAWALTGGDGSVDAVAAWRRKLSIPAGGNGRKFAA